VKQRAGTRLSQGWLVVSKFPADHLSPFVLVSWKQYLLSRIAIFPQAVFIARPVNRRLNAHRDGFGWLQDAGHALGLRSAWRAMCAVVKTATRASPARSPVCALHLHSFYNAVGLGWLRKMSIVSEEAMFTVQYIILRGQVVGLEPKRSAKSLTNESWPFAAKVWAQKSILVQPIYVHDM
jgi:hypothetical protein